jgi:hypothetical protein
MTRLPLSRRSFLKATAAKIASAGARVARAADNVTIGIVYGGPRDDFGWNQAHAVAAKALKQVPGVKVVEEENVPETDACVKSMDSMINLDGAEVEQNRLCRRQADRAGAQQHQLLHAGREKDQSARRRAGDLYRRMVAAGARSRSRQRLRGRRLRRRHLPRRRPQGDRDRREARRQDLWAQRFAGAARPKGFITGAEYKWETIYKGFAANLAKGEKLPNLVVGGYESDRVQNTAFGAGASEEARNAARAAIADLKAKKPIYVGPLKDNKGKIVVDKSYDNLDPFLFQIDFLLEGVVGSIT